MKKIITLVLAITLVVVSGICAFAAPAGFVESPTVDTPALDSYENESAGCTAEIIVTPFVRIDELDDAKEQENRDAYDEIVNNDDSFAKAMAKLAASKNLDVSVLAVSELFDVSYYETAGHDEHGAFTISIKVDNLDNFTGLLHRYNGKWVVVENATVNGNILTFTVDDLSPFAIVVDTSDDAPITDVEIPNTYAQVSAQTVIFAAAIVVSSGMIIAIVARQKKVKE